jgi:hypothetical protein
MRVSYYLTTRAESTNPMAEAPQALPDGVRRCDAVC